MAIAVQHPHAGTQQESVNPAPACQVHTSHACSLSLLFNSHRTHAAGLTCVLPYSGNIWRALYLYLTNLSPERFGKLPIARISAKHTYCVLPILN